MPRMVTLTSVKARGKWLPIGEIFDFTEEEIDQLKGQTPAALRYPSSDFVEERAQVEAEQADEQAAETARGTSRRGKRGKDSADASQGL